MKTKTLWTIIAFILLVSCSPASAPPPTSTPDVLYTPVELSPEEDAAYQKALADIPTYRQGDIQITVQDKNGNPLPGYQVKYRQLSHGFLFGSGADTLYADSLRQAGVNILNVSLDWKMLQPEDKVFDLETANSRLGIDEYKSGGWMLRGNGLFSQNAEDIPTFFKNITHAEFLGKLYLHEATVVKRFAPSVDYWEAIKDPNYETHNPLDKLQNEYFEAISTSVYAIRDNDPDALVEITFSSPCSELNDHDNLQALQSLLNSNINFDILVLQFHHPAENDPAAAISLAEMSACYDKYEEMLSPYERKIAVEFSAPSEAPAGQSGYWGLPWSEDTQAQYLVTAYSIFFSKPSIQGLSWGNASVNNSGLLNVDGTPKKSYRALQQLIESWRTAGESTTAEDGTLVIKGFAGSYEIEIINPANGASVTAQIQITEQESVSEIIEAP